MCASKHCPIFRVFKLRILELHSTHQRIKQTTRQIYTENHRFSKVLSVRQSHRHKWAWDRIPLPIA